VRSPMLIELQRSMCGADRARLFAGRTASHCDFRPHAVLVGPDGHQPDGFAVDAAFGLPRDPPSTVDCCPPDDSLTERSSEPSSFIVTVCLGGDESRDVHLATADGTDAQEFGG
jgi:hypothetical protein